MSKYDKEEVLRLAKGYALLNAYQHGGKARIGPVMSRLMAEKPELRPYAKEITGLVRKIVEEVNSLPVSEQQRILEEEYQWLLEREAAKRREKEEKTLPPLPEAVEGKVVTRFAPNPDFVIHLGNARPAILSHEYAKMYRGRMILRFEDTDPRTKTPLPEAYLLIKQDLRWLGVEWHEEYIQSMRMEIYYDIARRLISLGGAYVDTGTPEEFRKYRDEKKLEKYPHRIKSVEENLEQWDKMIEGEYGEGEAVLRVKTDPLHPDPSVRDWVAFRIIDTTKYPHPITGDRYTVWPTYNFAAAVDDHLMGVTHILRAREHRQNTVKQEFLYRHLGWKYPHVTHFGRLKLEGFIMSKSALKQLLKAGLLMGVDDPRFATIAGLRRRGILAETIRRVMIEVGVKQTDASISYKNLAAINRVVADNIAKRVMMVRNPVKLVVKNMPWNTLSLQVPFHPNADLGHREIVLRGPQEVFLIDGDDLVLLKPGRIIRLMEAFNIRIENTSRDVVEASYHSRSLEEARRAKAPIIQWILERDKTPVEVVVPQGLDLQLVKGYAEKALVEQVGVGEIVQFVRYGFARIDTKIELGGEKLVKTIFAHE